MVKALLHDFQQDKHKYIYALVHKSNKSEAMSNPNHLISESHSCIFHVNYVL